MTGVSYFLTGTDTGVGKTSVCVALIEAFKRKGIRVAAMKPVATGGIKTEAGIRNQDALRIIAHVNTCNEYQTINPVALTAFAAPVIAAKKAGVRITASPILEAYQKLSASADLVLVEGVGGWQIHLNENLWMSDLVRLLNLPVLLVVGIRLGCINHAILTAAAISLAGCRLHGWIANQIDKDYQDTEETLSLLSGTLAAPLLAVVPCLPQSEPEQQAAAMADFFLPHISRIYNLAG